MGDNINLINEALQNGNTVLFHILIPGVEISTKDDVVAFMDNSDDVIRITLEETEMYFKITKSEIKNVEVNENHFRIIMEAGVEVRFDVF